MTACPPAYVQVSSQKYFIQIQVKHGMKGQQGCDKINFSSETMIKNLGFHGDRH